MARWRHKVFVNRVWIEAEAKAKATAISIVSVVSGNVLVQRSELDRPRRMRFVQPARLKPQYTIEP